METLIVKVFRNDFAYSDVGELYKNEFKEHKTRLYKYCENINRKCYLSIAQGFEIMRTNSLVEVEYVSKLADKQQNDLIQILQAFITDGDINVINKNICLDYYTPKAAFVFKKLPEIKVVDVDFEI